MKNTDLTVTNSDETGIAVTFGKSGNSYTIDEYGNLKDIIAVGESRVGLNVGDYINYEPDETSQSTYLKDYLKESYTGSSSNSEDLTRTDLNWQILKIYVNGSMDLIGSPTDFTIHLSGARGYNNGAYVMDDICKTMYSRTGTTARSVDLEDFEKCLTEIGTTQKNNYISNTVNSLSIGTYITNVDKVNNRVTYVNSRSYYPVLWELQDNENQVYYNENTLIKEDGINISYKQADNLTVDNTYYHIAITETNYGNNYKALVNEKTFLLASRYTGTYSGNASFGLRLADSNVYGSYVFSNTGNAGTSNYSLRPVVSLGANVQVTACTGTNSTSNMHTINW